MDECEPPERDRIGELKRERIALQQKTFTKWVNAFLEKTGTQVQNIFTDFTDGKLLIKLLENISGEKIGIVSRGKQRIHKLENVSRVLEYLKKFIKLESIGAEDVVDGKEELILGLLWTIILRFSIADVQEESKDSKSVKDALLLWCQRKTKGYAGVNIVNFTSCWKNGLAFNALIHAHRPDLFDFNVLNGSQHIKNLTHAFDVASEKLGIAQLLDPEDVDVPRPDEKSIMMYIGMIYQYFSKLQQEKMSGKRLNKFVIELMELDGMKENYIRMVEELLLWLRQATDKLSKPIPTTISQLQMDMNEFKLFRTDEKPKKSVDRMKIEILFFEIQARLTGKRYKHYIPTKGYSLADVNVLWQNLERTEYIKEGKLKAELLRQEKISMLLEKFNIKASLRESWLSDKNLILDTESKPDNISPRDIPSSLKKHQGFEADLKAGEIRFSVLTKLLEELDALKYDDVKKLLYRKEKILKDWQKLLQKISARKKSLLSHKKFSSIIEDLDDLKFEVDTFQNFSLNCCGNTMMEVEEMIDIHEQDVNQFQSYCKRFEDLENKVKGLLKSSSHLSNSMNHKLVELANIKQIRLEQCNQKTKNLNLSQTVNYFFCNLIDLNATLSSKLKLAETRDVGADLMSLNKYKRKHEVLISEANSCFYQCDQLLQQWESISTAPFDVQNVQQEITVLQETSYKLNKLVNDRSKLLTEATFSLTYYMNASYAELWIKEKLQIITSENAFGSKTETEFFLKRLTDIYYEISIFQHEVDMLQRQFQEIDLYESVCHDDSNQQNELSNVLTFPLLFSQYCREEERCATHFDRENVSNRQLQLSASYLNLQQTCQERMQFLQLHLNYHVFLQSQQEVMVSLKEMEQTISMIDVVNDDIESVKRKAKQSSEDLKIYRSMSLNIEDQISTFITHPNYENVVLLKQQLIKMFSQLSVSLENLERNIFKLHGVNTFLDHCNQLSCWIKDKEGQLYAEYDVNNEHTVRRELKKQQRLEKEIDAIKNKKAAIQKGYDNLVKTGNILPQLVHEKIKEVEESFHSLTSLSSEQLNVLTTAYGIQGFTADAKDLLFCIKEKAAFLSEPLIADTLSDVNQCITLNEQEKDTVRQLQSDVNELIQYDISDKSSIKDIMEQLKDGIKNIHHLITSRSDHLEKQKTFLKNCKDLKKIKSHLSAYNVLLDHINSEKESLQISAGRLLQKHDEVQHKIHTDVKKLTSLKSELHCSVTCQTVLNLVGENEKLQCEVELRCDLVKSELIQLKAFQYFTEECDELLTWIQEKMDLLTCNGLKDSNVRKKKSNHENIQAEMFIHSALKKKLESKGFLLIEDCHFASYKITDLLHEIDGKWFKLEQIFKCKEEEWTDFTIHDEIIKNIKNFAAWLEVSQKKLAKPVCAPDLGSSRAMLLNHTKMQCEITTQSNQLQKSLEDCKKLRNSVIGRKSIDDVKNAQLKLHDLNEMYQKKRSIIAKELECHEFFQKTSFESLWVSDQLSMLSSLSKAKDLTSTRQMKNSLTAIEHQLISHQEVLNKLILHGEKLMNNNEDNFQRVNENINDLKSSWEALTKEVFNRKSDCCKSLDELEYLSEADVHIEWIDETISRASSAEYGKDLSSTERLLQKHKVLLVDISKYKKLLKGFFQSRKEIEITKAIQSKSKIIKSKFKKLENITEVRQRHLHDSYNLLYFYHEAGNLKLLLSDLNKNINNDDYGENYEQAYSLNEKFEHCCLSLPSAQKLFQKVCTLGNNLCQKNHPHKETIEGVLEKLCNMWKRFDGKVSQRRSRLLKACYFHKLNYDITDLRDHLNDYTEQLEQFKCSEEKSSYHLQNELRQLKLCVQEENLMTEKLEKLDTNCKEMVSLYPGKSLERLLKQKGDLEITLNLKKGHHNHLCTEYEETINTANFLVEIQSLQSWCHTFKSNISQQENIAVDYDSTKDALSDLTVILNQQKAKEDKLKCLQKTLDQLKVHEKEKLKFTGLLDAVNQSNQHNLIDYEDKLELLTVKLSFFSLKKDVHKVNKTLSSLEVSLSMEHADPGLHSQRLKKAEKHLALISAQIQNLCDVNTRVDVKDNDVIRNELTCLSEQEKRLSEIVLQSKNQMEKTEKFRLFCASYTELKNWIEEKLTCCSKDLSNLNHSIRTHKRLHTEIGIQKSVFEMLSKTGAEILCEDQDVDITEKLSSLFLLWEDLMKKVQQRDIELEDSKALIDITRSYNLIQSYLNDRMITIEKCSVHDDEDNLQMCTRNKVMLDNVKRGLVCDLERIKQFEEHVKKVTCKHNGISSQVNKMLVTLQTCLTDLQDLNEQRSVSIKEVIDYQTFIQNSKNLLEKMNDMIQQTSNTSIGSDLKSILLLIRKQVIIEANVLQFRNVKDNLHLEKDNLNPRFKVDVEKQLKQIERYFLQLDEKVRKRKLNLEAQHRLSSFFNDVQTLEDWIKNTMDKLSFKNSLNTPDEIEMQYRQYSELAIELRLQLKAQEDVQKVGETLSQEGQLSSIQLEPRLNGLKNGFEILKELLKTNEATFNKRTLLKNFEEKCDYAEACLQRNHALHGLIDALTSASLSLSVEQLMVQLKTATSGLKDQQLEIRNVRTTISSFTNEANPVSILNRCDNLIVKLQSGVDINLMKEGVLLILLRLSSFKERLAQIHNLLTDQEKSLANIKSCSSTKSMQNALMHFGATLKSYERMLQEVDEDFHKLSEENQSECLSDYNNLHAVMIKLQEKFSEWEHAITDMMKSECLQKEVEKIQTVIDKQKNILQTFEISEEKSVIMNWKERLVNIKADLTSVTGKLDELKMISTDNIFKIDVKKALQYLLMNYNEMLGVCEEKESIVKQAHVFLNLKEAAEEAKRWVKEKYKCVENVDIGGNMQGPEQLLKKFEMLLAEQNQHFKDEMTKLSEGMADTGGVFAQKIQQLLRDVESVQDQFKKKLTEKITFLKRTNQIQKVMENQKVLASIIKEKSLLLQKSDTGYDESSAIILLKRNCFLWNEVQDSSKDIQMLDEKILQFREWTEFQIFSSDILQQQESLKAQLRNAEVIVEKRSKMLENAAKVFQFKTELTSIDKWIQDQIGLIEIDGVGCNSTESESLLKETEQLVRSILVNEYRVTRFGELSQEILNQKPHSTVFQQISRNVENVFEMWNDMKELLQRRLHKLEAAYKMHIYYEKMSQVTQLCCNCLKDIGVIDVNVILGDLENAKNKYARMQVEFHAIGIHMDVLRKDEATVTPTCQHLDEWSVAPMIALSEAYTHLKEEFKVYESALINAERLRVYLAKAVHMCSWTEEFVSHGNRVIASLRKNKRNNQSSLIEFQKAFNEYKSREEQYDILVQEADDLRRFMTHCGDAFGHQESQLNSCWKILSALLEKWKVCVTECHDANDVMKDFEYIENWIDNQEEFSFDFIEDNNNNNNDDEGVLEKIEEALKDQIMLERLLCVQDENVQRVCLKYDQLENKRKRESNVDSLSIFGNNGKISYIKGNSNPESSDSVIEETNPSDEFTLNQKRMLSDNIVKMDNIGLLFENKEQKLSGLLKKSSTKKKKKVVFNTEHEMMDEFGKATIFYQLNDEQYFVNKNIKSKARQTADNNDDHNDNLDICFEDDVSVDDWSDSEDYEDVLIDMLPPPPQTFSDNGLFLQIDHASQNDQSYDI